DQERRRDFRRVRERRLEVIDVGLFPRREAPTPLAVQIVVVAVGAATLPDLVAPAPRLAEIGEEIRDAGAHADRGEEPRPRADERDAFTAVAVAIDPDVLRVDVAHLDHLLRRRLDAV